jgi:hypothetical protein
MGPRILAYGRDPNFPGWPDTMQLNYGNAELQAVRIYELTAIASKCVSVLARGGNSGGERAPGGMPDSMEPGVRVSERWSPGKCC